MKAHRSLPLIPALLWIFVVPFQSVAQTSDDLFDGDTLQEIHIYIAPQDYVTFKDTNFICEQQELAALAGQEISNLPRVVCDFAIEFHWEFQGRDVTLPQVSIKSHGKGSRSNIKPSFKIEFTRGRHTFFPLNKPQKGIRGHVPGWTAYLLRRWSQVRFLPGGHID